MEALSCYGQFRANVMGHSALLVATSARHHSGESASHGGCPAITPAAAGRTWRASIRQEAR